MELAEQPSCSLVFQECPTAFMNLTNIPLFQICPIPQRSALFSSIKSSFFFQVTLKPVFELWKARSHTNPGTNYRPQNTFHYELSFRQGNDSWPSTLSKAREKLNSDTSASGKALLPGKQVLSWNASSAKNPKSFDVFLLVFCFWVFFFFLV